MASSPQHKIWKNLGFELYKEWKGEEEFNKQMEELSKDPPAPGLFSKVQLKNTLTKFKIAFGLKALLSQKRATHAQGFGAIGHVEIVQEPKYPDQEFFTPGRRFLVRLRHGNLKFDDDAMADFRSASLKFFDSSGSPCFDVLMSTGCMGIFMSTQSVIDPLRSASGRITFKDYLLLNPIYLYNNIEGIRRAPESYSDQVYHSQLAFHFKAKDGVPRYVKYRMINTEGRPETGLLTEQEQRNIWDRDRYPEDHRPKDYLRQEFANRLENGPIKYKLQIQLHQICAEDSPHILNCAKAWDEDTHPWFDLADVTITTMLDDDIIEKTKYNIGNKPPSLSVIGPPKSIHDFKCISYYRHHVYKRSQKVRMLKSTHRDKRNMSEYAIEIETGDVKGGGTDSKISLIMTGSKGRTEAIVLDNRFHNDFERGSVDTFKIKTIDVGDLYIIQLQINRQGCFVLNSDWFVSKVTIVKEGSDVPYVFPCYAWVCHKLVAFHGEGVLVHQDQPEIIRFERQNQITRRQSIYQWMSNEDKFPDFPGHINARNHNEIPRDSQFSNPSMKSFHTGRLNALMNLGLSYLTTLTENWDSFDDFNKMLTSWVVKDRPKYAENDIWMDDAVFGMQFLNGTNPMMIERCTKLPDNFPVTQQLVGKFLDRDLTLEEEIKAGYVYIIDYSALEGIKRNGEGSSKVRYTAEPLMLLYVNSKNELRPIAIQLHQQPGDDNPIWTPDDDKLDWLFVKMWVRSADLQIHQMITHLLTTHLIMESFAISTWRNLPSIHPVFKLLFAHVRSIMAINTLGRKELINEGGITDVTLSIGGGGHLELIQKCYRNFTWDMLDIPASLAKRGLTDPDKLPNFYYRDDALALWQEIATFISDFIGLYYHSDDDVTQDTEIQSWVKDIHDNGITHANGHIFHQFPSSFQSRDQLIKLLTCVVFNCSCQHAAVNFSQLDIYAFIPNAPPTMQLPPPTKKGETTMQRIMDTLPSKWQTAWHVGTLHTLTRFAEDEKYLGDYSDGLFVDSKVFDVVAKFQEKLQEISDTIKTRNQSVQWPYIYLLPERVPNSVAI